MVLCSTFIFSDFAWEISRSNGECESAASTSDVVHELQGEKNLFYAMERICRTPAQEHCNSNCCQVSHVVAVMWRIEASCQRLSSALELEKKTRIGENPNVLNVTRGFRSRNEELLSCEQQRRGCLVLVSSVVGGQSGEMG